MSRKLIVVIVVAVVVVLAAGGFGVWFLIDTLGSLQTGGSYSSYKSVQVKIPTQANEQSLAVFGFRSTGDADARYYAVGFSRALADRLYCAPTGITQQIAAVDISRALHAEKHDPAIAPSDALALKVGRKLSVAWIITGDCAYSGGKLALKAKLWSTKSGKCETEYRTDCALGDLPGRQVAVADVIAREMGLKLSAMQKRELAKPNFANPQALALYGQAYAAKTDAQSEALRWQAVDEDPTALFPVQRVLEYYWYNSFPVPRLQGNKRLQALLSTCEQRFPGNSHIRLMKGLLLASQCRYGAAQRYLQKLAKDDPDLVRAHVALTDVALARLDGELAIKHGSEAVRLWPNEPRLHAWLAYAYEQEANNARRGHYLSEISVSKRNMWRFCCQKQLEEAAIAVRMDPNCSPGWIQLLSVSLQFGRNSDRDAAFEQLVLIDPKNYEAYERYANCFVPQWGGSTADLQRICARAESAFGKNAPEVYCIRAEYLSRYPMETRHLAEVLQNVERGLANSKTPNSYMLRMKSQALIELKRPEEALAIALQGVKKWNTTMWRLQLARCYAQLWDQRGDTAALKKAAVLFREYEQEIPFDLTGYLQYGWCLSHQGHRAEAKAEFLKGLRVDPASEILKEKMQYVQ